MNSKQYLQIPSNCFPFPRQVKFSSVQLGSFVVLQRVAAPDYDTVMNINEIDLIGNLKHDDPVLRSTVWPVQGLKSPKKNSFEKRLDI